MSYNLAITIPAHGSSHGQGGPGPYARVALRTFSLKPPEALYDPASVARRDCDFAMYSHVLLNGKPKEVDKTPKRYFDFFYIDFTPKMYYDCHKLFDSTSFAEMGAATTSIDMRPTCVADGLLHL